MGTSRCQALSCGGWHEGLHLIYAQIAQVVLSILAACQGIVLLNEMSIAAHVLQLAFSFRKRRQMMISDGISERRWLAQRRISGVFQAAIGRMADVSKGHNCCSAVGDTSTACLTWRGIAKQPKQKYGII